MSFDVTSARVAAAPEAIESTATIASRVRTRRLIPPLSASPSGSLSVGRRLCGYLSLECVEASADLGCEREVLLSPAAVEGLIQGVYRLFGPVPGREHFRQVPECEALDVERVVL